ncbi:MULTISPECIES: diacylglycerol kinase [Ralstonia]|jgi:diacylglycerol kinase (ATP)|uniref:Diacylglycerol kinase n=1 Tax=Ralstonia flaminis TaxID=3058597 RepID=A0ABM9JXG5_9RALS|nr:MULTISPECIES: diacylglycerol kinase [unclassified Ralstonia]CAJ0806825.1 hypothetical protein LMG18101_00127 [Ralstonia sp. LMG 18101]
MKPTTPPERPAPPPAAGAYSPADNPHKGNRGITRAWFALKNSISGIRFAIDEESAFRQELTLCAILLPCAFVIPATVVERILMLGTLVLVLIVELLNSSVEAAVDRISLEQHGLSKRAKDFGSAAVMLALLLCVGTWVAIAWPWVASLVH